MHSHPKEADLPALLAELCDAGVEFIVLGGVAAVLQGVPITTIDLDIVHRRWLFPGTQIRRINPGRGSPIAAVVTRSERWSMTPDHVLAGRPVGWNSAISADGGYGRYAMSGA